MNFGSESMIMNLSRVMTQVKGFSFPKEKGFHLNRMNVRYVYALPGMNIYKTISMRPDLFSFTSAHYGFLNVRTPYSFTSRLKWRGMKADLVVAPNDLDTYLAKLSSKGELDLLPKRVRDSETLRQYIAELSGSYPTLRMSSACELVTLMRDAFYILSDPFLSFLDSTCFSKCVYVLGREQSIDLDNLLSGLGVNLSHSDVERVPSIIEAGAYGLFLVTNSSVSAFVNHNLDNLTEVVPNGLKPLLGCKKVIYI